MERWGQQMLVIVEGADGSGKTTLVKQLVQNGCVQFSIPGCERSHTLYCAMSIMSRNLDTVFVTDRSFITDMVYRIVDGKNRTDLSLEDALHILKNSLIVFCDNSSAFEDAVKRGEDNIVDKKKHAKIRETYRTIIKLFNKFHDVPYFEYDWHNENVYQVLSIINKYKEERDGVR